MMCDFFAVRFVMKMTVCILWNVGQLSHRHIRQKVLATS